MNTTIKQEHAGEAFGVKGRFFNVVVWPESTEIERCRGKIANQKFKATRTASDGGKITVEVRFDDNCKNGHEDLAITGDWKHKDGGWSGGCLHEEIALTFPEFAPLIPFHLCSTDGPMHYIPNTLYHAGDKDCWGKRKGEPRAVKFYVRPAGGSGLLVEWPEEGENPILGPKVQTYRSREEAQGVADACGGEVVEFITMRGEGKERDLDAARSCAIWPEATDEELMADDLKERLIERLPALLVEFRQLVEGFGFLYGVPVST